MVRRCNRVKIVFILVCFLSTFAFVQEKPVKEDKQLSVKGDSHEGKKFAEKTKFHKVLVKRFLPAGGKSNGVSGICL